MNLQEIDVQKAKELLDQGAATFADIRDPDSYQAAHIPGATHLSDGNIRDFVEEGDKARPLVVYCYHGNSSKGAALYLQEQGFQDVYSMAGGFEVWRSAHGEAGG